MMASSPASVKDSNKYRSVSGECYQILSRSMQIVRESILLDQGGHPIPMSQVMPKYIPKEPVKACVSSPFGKSELPGHVGSHPQTEVESDNCSIVASPSASNLGSIPEVENLQSRIGKHRSRKNRHRARKNSSPNTAPKPRPINIVGPIISPTEPVEGEDREEVLSASGAESLGSEAADQRLHDEVLAQRKLISKLEEDLNSQLKVNGELKKLLVASVGSDLEYRVEKLAQDKAQLSATVGSYSEKLYKDFEDLDRISIQADMWRSKYLASRLQTEELSCKLEGITTKYTEATSALQQMLDERHSINNNLYSACNFLTSGRDPRERGKSTHQLSVDLLRVSRSVSGKSDSEIQHLNQSAATEPLKGLSQSERAAYEVLSGQQIPILQVEVPHTEEIPRYRSLLCTSLPAALQNRPKIFTI